MKKAFAIVLALLAFAAPVMAADWPEKTVNVILPYGAGGDTDTYCRQLFQRVSALTGQTFVVINEQGGSGIVAAMDVMNRAPDGYTILYSQEVRGQVPQGHGPGHR